MSAAAAQRREAPSRRVRFAEEDLVRIFGERLLKRGRQLVLESAVSLTATEPPDIAGIVAEGGIGHRVVLTPGQSGARTAFSSSCGCGTAVCFHRAAVALAVLDRDPAWRRPVQPSLFDLAPELLPLVTRERHIRFELEPGVGDYALFVGVFAESVARGVTIIEESTPTAAADEADEPGRVLCRLLGGSDQHRVAVLARRKALVDLVLKQALATGRARWKSSGRRLVAGPPCRITALRNTQTGALIPIGFRKGSAVIEGASRWYVDAATGHVGTAELVVSETRRVRMPSPEIERPAATGGPAVIVDGEPRPVLALFKAAPPSGEAAIDVARLSFSYGDTQIEAESERQFARSPDGVVFYRRDRGREASAIDRLRRGGLSMMRLASENGEHGARVFLFHGRDAAEEWREFAAAQLPALESEGWCIEVAADFGTRRVEAGSEWLAEVADTEDGWFSLDIGIEIEGKRVPLLPILTALIEQGGIATARIVDGRVHAALADGRIAALPADRVAKLLAIISEMADAGRLTAAGTMVLPAAEAAGVLDIESVATTRWRDAAAIRAYATILQGGDTPLEVAPPDLFTAQLRPYQQQGLDWLQHLRQHGMAGILADDMGLGKTAQTLAHIAVEHEAARLDRPALIVVPTSLVANWVSEAAKFTPSLQLIVLHGLDRHERRKGLDGAQLVVTTYTVLARDIEAMRAIEWHLVVLDESQAIKNPDAKATRAVRALQARHRLCLSGTPVENNLGEMWSQFAFLMPGLLGDRRGFVRRFRTPIEKHGDTARRALLARRLKPFLLRRTKSEVEADLPPKTEIVRRVALESDQRDLYETIRLTMHDKVRGEIAVHSLERSQILVLDALLKLRQVCCDPRLVKLAAARSVVGSGKLAALMGMLGELASEGRRALVFSQFTSMLDLVEPELTRAGIAFVELTGATADRATPVNRFQSGAVPVFLISLKAGGRGLNLTAADTVIHYDPWWNPAAENQATDRAHRIGQDKPVFVYKLIAAGTVEERILELQARKGRLAAATLDSAGASPLLAAEDLDYLFGA